MRAAGIVLVLSALVGATALPDAFGQTIKPMGPMMCACPGKHKPLGSSRTCEEACFGSAPAPRGGGSTGSSPAPSIDYEAQRRAHEAEELREQQESDARRRTEDAERQARFIRDRDATADTLKGSIGTRVGPNSPGGTELRGSDVEVGRQLLKAPERQPDVGGRQAAWKQLHCAASILGPAISALDLGGKSGKADYSEFRFLADEAANALNGQKLRVSCAPAPAMPQSFGSAKDPARQAEAERRVVAKVRDLGTKLEDARRKQDEAQAKLRGDAAPKVDPAIADVVEQQRRINRARDSAGNETAKAQRDFNEGKRSEEGAKKELKKIQEKVESLVKGERVTFDEEPPVASRGKK